MDNDFDRTAAQRAHDAAVRAAQGGASWTSIVHAVLEAINFHQMQEFIDKLVEDEQYRTDVQVGRLVALNEQLRHRIEELERR